MTNALLPCPFCGGKAWLNDYEAKHGDMTPRSRCPQCSSCGCNLGFLPTPDKAIAAWNSRALLPAPTTGDTPHDRRAEDRQGNSEVKAIGIGAAAGAAIGFAVGGSIGVVGHGMASSGALPLAIVFGIIGALGGWVYSLKRRS